MEMNGGFLVTKIKQLGDRIFEKILSEKNIDASHKFVFPLPVVSLLKKNMRRPGSGRRIFISLSVPPPARAVPRGRRWASAPLFS